MTDLQANVGNLRRLSRLPNTIKRAYRVELDLTSKQAIRFSKHADAARWAYNYALGRVRDTLQWNQLPAVRMRLPTAIDLHREVVRLKRSTHLWLADVSKYAPQMALRDAEQAFRHFWRDKKSGRDHYGFPRFKSKRDDKRSFRLGGNAPSDPDLIVVTGRRIKLPFIGWVRVKHGDARYIPPKDMKINSATVSLVARRWFLSLQVTIPEKRCEPPLGPVLGVDLGVGVDNFAVISDGAREIAIKSPRPLRRHERKLKRLQRSLSHKKDGSVRREKAKTAVQRKHFKISNIRSNFMHQVTTRLAKTSPVIVVENLSLKKMVQQTSRGLAKSISDAALGEFLRQLDYKTAWNGGRLIRVDPAYTTQDCSACGKRHPEWSDLSVRTVKCECGLSLARDANAARNVRRRYLQSPEVIGRLETPVEFGSLTENISTAAP